MSTKVDLIIRNIKLYELGISDIPKGYDALSAIKALGQLPTQDSNLIIYGDIKGHIKVNAFNKNNEAFVSKYIWVDAQVGFDLTYNETKELIIYSMKTYHGLVIEKVAPNVF